MMAFAQFIILFASLVVTTVCACIWGLLGMRMWRDFRPGSYKICGTIWAVLLWGTVSGLCGLGAYTVAAATVATLLDMLP